MFEMELKYVHFEFGGLMKIAIIGSRKLKIDNFADYIKDDVTEIVSGGACGIDTCAKEYTLSKCINIQNFYPNTVDLADMRL